jgi:rare lipoprotein A (peptidoglycan hydrolase)
LSYGSRSVTVPVIDRGPYVAGRTLDLSNATKIALGCTDLCTLRMQVGR